MDAGHGRPCSIDEELSGSDKENNPETAGGSEKKPSINSSAASPLNEKFQDSDHDDHQQQPATSSSTNNHTYHSPSTSPSILPNSPSTDKYPQPYFITHLASLGLWAGGTVGGFSIHPHDLQSFSLALISTKNTFKAAKNLRKMCESYGVLAHEQGILWRRYWDEVVEKENELEREEGEFWEEGEIEESPPSQGGYGYGSGREEGRFGG